MCQEKEEVVAEPVPLRLFDGECVQSLASSSRGVPDGECTEPQEEQEQRFDRDERKADAGDGSDRCQRSSEAVDHLNRSHGGGQLRASQVVVKLGPLVVDELGTADGIGELAGSMGFDLAAHQPRNFARRRCGQPHQNGDDGQRHDGGNGRAHRERSVLAEQDAQQVFRHQDLCGGAESRQHFEHADDNQLTRRSSPGQTEGSSQLFGETTPRATCRWRCEQLVERLGSLSQRSTPFLDAMRGTTPEWPRGSPARVPFGRACRACLESWAAPRSRTTAP